MKRLTIISIIACTLLPLFVTAQQKRTGSTQYNFTEVWVWEYKGRDGKMGEMAIYREPKLNYWLLTAEAYGNSDDMCDWILIKPDGTYYMAYKDAELGGGRTLLKMKQALPKVKSIPANWKASVKQKNFGNASMGFPVFRGKEYKVSYLKTNENSTFYLATTKANFAPLSVFNELDADAKLPIRFPKDIPGNFIPLSENTVFPGGLIQYSFKYISYTEYHLNLAEYGFND